MEVAFFCLTKSLFYLSLYIFKFFAAFFFPDRSVTAGRWYCDKILWVTKNGRLCLCVVLFETVYLSRPEGYKEIAGEREVRIYLDMSKLWSIQLHILLRFFSSPVILVLFIIKEYYSFFWERNQKIVSSPNVLGKNNKPYSKSSKREKKKTVTKNTKFSQIC